MFKVIGGILIILGITLGWIQTGQVVLNPHAGSLVEFACNKENGIDLSALSAEAKQQYTSRCKQAVAATRVLEDSSFTTATRSSIIALLLIFIGIIVIYKGKQYVPVKNV